MINTKLKYITENNRSGYKSIRRYNKYRSYYGYGWGVVVLLLFVWCCVPVMAAGKKNTAKKTAKAKVKAKAATKAKRIAKTSAKVATHKKQPVTLKNMNAVITAIKGKSVQVSLDSGKTWTTAKKTMRLPANSLIRTGFASSCEISFAGKSILQVQSLSSVRIADFAGTTTGSGKPKMKVKANLQYGAVKCGVEKGRVKNDTKITTPVATLSIRGTVVEVKYYPGVRHCLLAVDEGGPAYARCLRPVLTSANSYKTAMLPAEKNISQPQQPTATAQSKPAKPIVPSYMSDPNTVVGVYRLDEGMRTNERLSRYLQLVSFERYVWVTGDHVVGDISDTEAMAEVPFDGTLNPVTGHFQYNSQRLRYSQKAPVSEIEFPGGDIPIGRTDKPQ